MAVRDGKILAVTNDAELSSCASARTRVMDLHGQTILPGLIDVHTHSMEWVKGILRGEIDASYPAVQSIADITNEIEKRAATLPAGQWILGSGWDDAKLAEKR
jgi:hypothetical protein